MTNNILESKLTFVVSKYEDVEFFINGQYICAESWEGIDNIKEHVENNKVKIFFERLKTDLHWDEVDCIKNLFDRLTYAGPEGNWIITHFENEFKEKLKEYEEWND